MDRVYQVFVSSTYADLKDERRRVSETLAKAGHIPAGMELFPATDQQQLEFIKRVIDRCDYYVVIVGGRYGSLADENVSFTEKEYEYAAEKGVPVLAFLHGDPDAIPVGKTDQDNKKIEKLKAFRDRLANGRMIDFWSEPNELCTKVVIAVGQAANLSPGIGWIRGDQAIDPKLVQELERIRVENDQLKKRLTELDAHEISFPDNLLGPNDDFSFTILGLAPKMEPQEISAKWPIGNLFAHITEALIAEKSESYIGDHIARFYMDNRASNEFKSERVFRIAEMDLTKLRFHLEALGLIRAVGRHTSTKLGDHEFHSDHIVWTITEKGRRFVSGLWAMRSTEEI